MTTITPPVTFEQRIATIRLKFDANLLRLLAPFNAKRDIRYYLQGLRIERAVDKEKGIYLIASDGHRLAAYYDADGQIVGDDGRGVILRMPTDLLAAVGKTKLPERIGLKVIGRGSRVSLAPDFGHEHSAKERYVMPGQPYIEANYSDWRRVLPDFEKLQTSVTGAFNAEYLASFASLIKNEKGHPGVRLWQEETQDAYTGKPVIIQVPAHPTFLGVIMPMRVDINKDQMHAVLDAKPRKDPVIQYDNTQNTQNC
jgi:hypothetical protein